MTAHLWDRLVDAKASLTPVQSKYRIVWEDPAEADAPAKIGIIDPNWLAAALAGGVLPPIEAYLQDAELGVVTHSYWPARGPMTEEEAVEYWIKAFVPPSVWRDYRGNRRILAIVPVEAIPTDRTYRNSWRVEALAA